MAVQSTPENIERNRQAQANLDAIKAEAALHPYSEDMSGEALRAYNVWNKDYIQRLRQAEEVERASRISAGAYPTSSKQVAETKARLEEAKQRHEETGQSISTEFGNVVREELGAKGAGKPISQLNPREKQEYDSRIAAGFSNEQAGQLAVLDQSQRDLYDIARRQPNYNHQQAIQLIGETGALSQAELDSIRNKLELSVPLDVATEETTQMLDISEQTGATQKVSAADLEKYNKLSGREKFNYGKEIGVIPNDFSLSEDGNIAVDVVGAIKRGIPEDTIKKWGISQYSIDKSKAWIALSELPDIVAADKANNEVIRQARVYGLLTDYDKYNRQIQTIQDNNQRQIESIANTKGIKLSDRTNPSTYELRQLMEAGASPQDLVLAGYDIGKVNIAVAEINAEYQKWETANAKLSQSGLGTPDKPYTIAALSAWQSDNPNDKETLSTLFKPDVVNQVNEYNDKISSAISDIDKYMATDKYGAMGLAIENAISENNIRVYPDWEIKSETSGYGTVVTYFIRGDKVLQPKDIVKYYWDNELTPEQKQTVAITVANDPTTGNYFAAYNRGLNIVAEQGGLVGQLALAPVIQVTNPIAKQMTLADAKALMDKEYQTELAAVSDFKKDNGTIDVNSLQWAVDYSPSLKSQILEQAGYDNFDDLKQNLQYYNNMVQVSPEEWAVGGATLALDLLAMGGGGLLGGGTRWVNSGIQIGAAGVFAPGSIRTIKDPQTSLAEKIVAGAVPILLITGGLTELKGAKAGMPEASEVGKVKNVSEVAAKTSKPFVQRLGEGIETTAYGTTKFLVDEKGGVMEITPLEYPNFRMVLKNAIGQIKYDITGTAQAIKRAVADITDGTMVKALEAREAVLNTLATEIKMPDIVGMARYLATELKIDVTKLAKMTAEQANRLIESQMINLIKAREAGLNVLSTDVSGAIKYYANDLRLSLLKQYNNLADNAMVKALEAREDVLNVLSTKVFPSISDIRGIAAQKAALARYLATNLKLDMVRLAKMTTEQASKYIESQMVNLIKAQNRALDVLSTDVSGAIKYYSTELARNIKQSYNNISEAAIVEALKAREGVLNVLSKEISTSIFKRQRELAAYLINSARLGIRRGIADAYTASNIRKLMDDIETAIKTGNKQMLEQSGEQLAKLGAELPESIDGGKLLAENGKAIAGNAENIIREAGSPLITEIEEYMAKMARLREYTKSTQLQDIETYLKAVSRSNEEIAKYLDDLYKKGMIDDIETFLRARGKSADEIAAYLDKLGKSGTLDDIETFLKAQEKGKPSDTSGVDDVLNDIDEYLKTNKDATVDDYLKDKGGEGGTKTAIKEKTEVKTETKPETETKTAEELEKELYPETKTEVKPETKTGIEATPKTGTGITPAIPIPEGTDLTYPTIISYPFDPELNPDAAREFERLIANVRLTRGYVEEIEQDITKEIEDRITELSRTMTLAQAIKQALEEAAAESTNEPVNMPVFEPVMQPTPTEQPQPEPTPTPTPEPEPMPTQELMPTPIPEPEPVPMPEPEPTPVPVETIPEEPVTIKPIVPITIKVKDSEGREKEIDTSKGIGVWIQGRPTGGAMYKIYYGVDNQVYTTRDKPQGYKDEGWTGAGSAVKSFQLIGGKNLAPGMYDMGIALVNIRPANFDNEITFRADPNDVPSGGNYMKRLNKTNRLMEGERYQVYEPEYIETGKSATEKNSNIIINESGENSREERRKKRIAEIYNIGEGDIKLPMFNPRPFYEDNEPEISDKPSKKSRGTPDPTERYYRGHPILPADLGTGGL